MPDDSANSDDQTLLPSTTHNDPTLAPASGLEVQPAITEPTLSGLERLETYEQQNRIASWTYGDVFEASHPKLDRQVWLVVLNEESLADKNARSTFIDRARVLASIEHPNVQARIWEAIDEDDVVYVACEPPTGNRFSGKNEVSLPEKSDVWFIDTSETTSMICQGLTGLCAMHEIGIHHGTLDENSIFVHPTTKEISVSGWVASGFEPQGTEQSYQPNHAQKSAPHQDFRDLSLVFCKSFCTESVDQLRECNSPRAIRKLLAKNSPHVASTARSTLSKLAFPSRSKIDSVDAARRLTNRLIRFNETSPRLVSWIGRIGTLPYEMLTYFLILPLVAFFAGSSDPTPGAVATVASLALLPSFFFEVLFRTNLGRRLRGVRLMDRTGSRPGRWPLFYRWLLRFVSIATFGSLAMLLIYVGYVVAGVEFPSDVAWASPPIGLAITYLTGLFLPHRRPIHDYYSGVTLGKLVPANSMASGSTRFSVADQTTHTGSDRKSLPSEPRAPMSGKVDQYELIKMLGQGGMGSVYAAIDPTLNRKVAIKTISNELVTGSEALARFEREAKLGAQLGHENIAKVIGVGRHAGAPYLVMEFIDGQDLQEVVSRDGAFPPEQAWNYITQAARGLQAVNALGIVHRDIKPANLILATSGAVKVMDFGVSKRTVDSDEFAEPATPDFGLSELAGDEGLTQLGALIGTPMYMSPEQAAGKEVDTSSDIYSLGLTLWFLLSGKPPYEYREKLDLIAKQISETPSMTTGNLSALSVDQKRVLERMICKDIEGRYRDYDSLLADLDLTRPQPFETVGLDLRIQAILITAIPIVFIAAVASGLVSSFVPTIISDIAFALVYIVGTWRFGQTPGKWGRGLKVVSLDGGPVSFWQSVVRYLGSIPVGIGTLFGLLTGFTGICQLAWPVAALAIYIDRNNRAPHDYLAGTKVVKLPKRIDSSLLSDISPNKHSDS